MAGSGRETRRGWEVPVERSEANAEEQRIPNAKADCRNEQNDGYQSGGPSARHVHDTITIICSSALFILVSLSPAPDETEPLPSISVQRQCKTSRKIRSLQLR